MASLDTNCLLRLALDDIPRQVAKVEKLLSSGADFEVEDMAIMETVYGLEKGMKVSRSSIVEFLKTIIYRNNINCNRRLFGEVLPIYEKHPKLSFVDICLSVYARLNKAEPLLTFDRKLANQLSNAREI